MPVVYVFITIYSHVFAWFLVFRFNLLMLPRIPSNEGNDVNGETWKMVGDHEWWLMNEWKAHKLDENEGQQKLIR